MRARSAPSRSVPGEGCAIRVLALQVGALQFGAGHARSAEVGMPQVSVSQFTAFQVSTGHPGSSQVGVAGSAGRADAGPFRLMWTIAIVQCPLQMRAVDTRELDGPD
jgi:hypothetical protein